MRPLERRVGHGLRGRELDNNFPTIVGFGDEYRLGTSGSRIRLIFVMELDLESGDVEKKPSAGDDIGIHLTVKRFQLRDVPRQRRGEPCNFLVLWFVRASGPATIMESGVER